MWLTFHRIFVLAVMAASASFAAWANVEPRLALIIGNASYKSSPLNNPVNDARLMEKVLKETGFTVIKAENASIREMRRLVRDFGDKLKASGGIGLFYFAGHGVQVRGENFLVSTDSEILNEDEIADDSVNVSVVLEKMQTAGNRMNLIILDACRNNPFASKSRAALSGLAALSAPSGSLVAYATAPGAMASDGTRRNGLYTEHLARAIVQPGLTVEEVFKQVRSSVRRDSNFQQTPWENTALEGQFFFKAAISAAAATSPLALPGSVKPVPTAAQPSRPDPIVLDMAFWESVKSSQLIGEFQAYLERFPAGVFSTLARIRIAEIKAQPVAPPKPVVIASLGNSQAAASISSTAAANPNAPQKTMGDQPPNGVLGDLLLTDTFFGKKTKIAVTSQPEPGQTVYSSGDVVDKNGNVRQVRVGEMVLGVESGSLWSFPLKVASGEANVNTVQAPDLLPGNISWKTTALADGKFRVEAYVKYFVMHNSRMRLQVYGNWTATYNNNGELPESSSTVMTGPYGTSNMVSAEFRSR